MLPALDFQRVRRWCAGRVPEHLQDERRVEVDVAPLHLKFHRYDRAEPSPHAVDLLDEIERDPTAIFWG